ncbi:MAG: leucine-rich repeat protein [Oscillospiraceae bacterium]|nr:leucine-rich repeat protein [Oscillospiraceae bacterium]
MKNFKKLLSIHLVAAMLTGILPVHALDLSAAAAGSVASGAGVIESIHVNPEYEHLPLDLPEPQKDLLLPSGETKTVATLEEAAAYLREQMALRASTVTFALTDYNYVSDEQVKADWNAMLDEAFAHTGDPKYGDYLDRHYGGCRMSGSMSGTTLTTTYTVEYYTTAAQEAELDAAVETLLSDLEAEHAISTLSDYDKIHIIYDYICDNVVYDNANLNDDTYKLKYTAYAALVNGTSVCQGYASLFYRLALTLGVDARYISGYANGGNHGWNIVDMGGNYYYLDATWDAGETVYSYFLMGSEQFHADHTPGEEYLTAEFAAQYPIDTENFVHPDYVVASGTCGDDIAWSLSSNGHLALTGTGAMTDYSSSADIPWTDFTGAVKSVSVGEGITELTFCAFYYCTNMSEITLPASLEVIDQNAFLNCDALATVYYGGTEEQWLRHIIIHATGNDALDNAEVIFTERTPTTHTLADGGDLLALLASDSVRDGDTIELLGSAHVNDVNSDSAPLVIGKAVTITGGTINLRAGGILLGADVTFDAVTLSFANRVRNAVIANGHTLTLIDVTQDSSTNEVHLFCGSLTGHAVTAPMGEHGTIIIRGTTSLGNIYAGSLSSDGAANTFALPATVIVDSTATGTMGEFYACGALETPVPGNEILNPDYIVAPPTAREDAFIVTGEVRLALYQGVIAAVNGTTGGASNAHVTYNGNDYLCTPTLNHVGALTVATGNLQPKALTENISITLTPDAQLDLCELADDFTAAGFNGGGTLVLGETQILTVAGEVTGTTAIALGGVDYYGMSVLAFRDRTFYIVTSADVSGSFTALSESFTLENIDGNWTAVAVEADAPVVKPESFTIGQTEYTASVEEMADGIVVAAAFTGLTEDEFFSDIPLTITISKDGADAVTVDRSYDSEWGYLYGAVHGIAISTAEEDTGLSLYFYNDYISDAPVAEGVYTITIAATLADDSVCALTLTLTVGEETPEGPALIASGTCGENLTWTLTDDGTLTISGEGEMESCLWDPQPWADYRDSIYSIVIGDSVTTIGDFAFSRCSALTSVEIGDSVTTIGDDAFSSCSALTNAVIGDSVTTIGGGAFGFCETLTSVAIPDSVTTIGCFAFDCCYALTSVVIGDSVTTIENHAFSRCYTLASITVSENNPDYCDVDGVLFTKDMNTLVVYPAGKAKATYEITDGVTTIGAGAFNSCYALASIVIPDSVTTIGDSAFCYCDALTSVVIGDSVTTIGDYAFSGCTALTSVVIPDSVTTIGNSAFAYCTALASAVIGDSVTTIDNLAFYLCSALTSVTLGSNVTSIGAEAFHGCTALASVTYDGTGSQWNAIEIGEGNDPLLNAEKIFTGPLAGDLNGDDAVTVRDVIILLDAIAALTTGEWTGDQRTVADVSGDGRITICDAIIILDSIAAGTTSEL